jgi:hypothetical protein
MTKTAALGTTLSNSRSYKKMSGIMSYPWPFEQPDPVLQRALEIAVNYLDSTKQAYPFSVTEIACGRVILDEWLTGKRRHPLWLANKAIVAIESKQPMLGPVAVRAAGPRNGS